MKEFNTNGMTKLTKADIAYNTIKEKVLDEEYRPGQVLTEIELSETLGISRTPIRTALAKLAVDGYLNIIPDQGIFVSQMHIEELMEWYDIRMGLEGIAASLFAQRKTPKSIEMLEECYLLHKDAHPSGDYSKAIELDDEYHLDLAQGSCNEQLINLLKNAISHCKRRFSLSAQMSDSQDLLMTSQHLLILEAIKAGNAHDAEAYARQHVSAIKEVQKEYFLNYYSNRYIELN